MNFVICLRTYDPIFGWLPAICYLGFTITMVELILAGLPYHAASRLKILKYNLLNPERDTTKIKSNCRITFENAERIFKDCVTLHNKVLE